jgi:hypothetical protein
MTPHIFFVNVKGQTMFNKGGGLKESALRAAIYKSQFKD